MSRSQLVKGGVDVMTVYPPVGRCIYCGAQEQELEQEHILPYGLAGDAMILPKASCRPCATITGKAEGFCLRPMYGRARIRLGLPTRRPKERPTVLTIDFIRADGTRGQETVPADKAPLALVGYQFPPPGILRGVPPTDDFDGAPVLRRPVEEVRRDVNSSGRRVKYATINPLIFSRMLAKIGHSYAVAELGLNAFRPVLLDLILGRSDAGSYVVGGDPSPVVGPTEDKLHDLYLQDRVSAGVEYVVVAVQLFSFAGMPRYHVVVGERLRGHSAHARARDLGITASQ